MAMALNLTGLLPDERWVAEMRADASMECEAFRTHHRADVVYVVTMGARIIQMQSGFAMLESAYQQPNNSANIMMKNMLDLCIGVLAFFFFGYYIAYWDTHQIGGLADAGVDLAHWFCCFSYATTAATINSGALAGRVAFFPYLFLSTVMTGVLYPICAYLSWGNGWLQQIGFVDFAGSVVVHQVGAVSALVSTCILGPRIGRFKNYRAWKGIWAVAFWERHDDAYYREPQDPAEKKVFIPFRKCRHPVQLLFGTFLLLVGFLAFNPASTFATTLGQDLIVAHSSATTLLAAAGGGIGGMLFSMVFTRSTVVRVPELTNAVIAGLVASCAPAAVMPLSVSPLVGFIAAILTLGFEEMLAYKQIDDAVGAVAAHGPSGAWGAIAVALFADKHCGGNPDVVGVFFGGGEEAWLLLAKQLLGMVVLCGISIVITYVSVYLIDVIFGFRCTRACELIGLDYWEHQFNDGSFEKDTDKAAFFNAAKLRESLSSSSSCWPAFNSPEKRYMAEQKVRELNEEEAQKHALEGEPKEKKDHHAEANMDLGIEVSILKKQVETLQAQIHLLAAGKMRDEAAEGAVGEDMFGNQDGGEEEERCTRGL